MTTLSGGMTGAGVISRGTVTPSGPVRVGLTGVEPAIGVAATGGWGGILAGVWASRDRAAAYRERTGSNLIKTMISKGGNGGLDKRAHGDFGNGAATVGGSGAGR